MDVSKLLPSVLKVAGIQLTPQSAAQIGQLLEQAPQKANELVKYVVSAVQDFDRRLSEIEERQRQTIALIGTLSSDEITRQVQEARALHAAGSFHYADIHKPTDHLPEIVITSDEPFDSAQVVHDTTVKEAEDGRRRNGNSNQSTGSESGTDTANFG